MLASMFSGRHHLDTDKDGNFFIDRNGKYFEHILDFLRDDRHLPPKEDFEEVLNDAEYFGIEAYVERLKNSPPLFPKYVLLERSRSSVNDYHEIKEEVVKLAKLNSFNDFSKIHSESTSSVYIVKYMELPSLFQGIIPDETTGQKLLVRSFEDVKANWVHPENVRSTVCIKEENIGDFEGFVRVLVYDLRQEGYNVHYSYTCNYTKPRWNDIEYKNTNTVIMKFIWESIPI